VALIDLVVSSYAPWLLVFSLHVWIFQSIEDDRESAHRRLQLDINAYLKSIQGNADLESSARDSLSKAIDTIYSKTRKCYDTFFAQLTTLAIGIFSIVSAGDLLPTWVSGLLIASIFVIMTFMLYVAVEARHVVRSTSLGF
jgi:hypothetical protein